MGWLAGLGALLQVILPSLKDVLPKVAGNAEARETAAANENVAAQEAYSKEWSYAANNRSWWDGLCDGLNRLPRPLMAISALLFPIAAFHNPTHFAVTMKALQLVPDPVWTLLAIVVSFYFTSRTLEKVNWKTFSRAGAAVPAAKLASLPGEGAAVGLLARQADDPMLDLAGLRGGELPRARPHWRNPIALRYGIKPDDVKA